MNGPTDSLTKRVGLAAAVGAALGFAGLVVATFTFAPGAFAPMEAIRFVAVPAAVCALGRMLGGGLVGAALGLVVGFTFGLAASGEEKKSEKPHALVGKQVAIAGPTLDGPLDISQYRGKVVLVDFWATWCTPCTAEIERHLKTLYRQTSRDDFEIVGVSLDRRRDELEKYVSAQNIGWPHLFFDEQEKGRTNPVASRYGVDSIPHTMLIGREGEVVAVGLRGEELTREIKRLVGETAPERGVPIAAWIVAAVLGLIGAIVQGNFGTKALGSPT